MKRKTALSLRLLVDELKILRQIANKLVLGRRQISEVHDDIIASFTLRSRRLVANESIADHLAEAAAPDDKIERLLLIEENIIGVENKRQLAFFAMPITHLGAAFESYFIGRKHAASYHECKRLAELQARVRRSWDSRTRKRRGHLGNTRQDRL